MSGSFDDAPAATWRLFPHHSPVELDPNGSGAFVIGRLLEEGDSSDLTWLIQRAGESEIAKWVRRRGGRQLSSRSLAFWTVLLDLESPKGTDNPLWPI